VRARVEAMLGAGFVDEVRGLSARGLGEARALDAVGYRQVREALRAEAEGGPTPDREALAESIVRATRIFARRQRTWLRDEPVEWLPPSTLEDAAALDALAERLAPLLRGEPRRA
jgi:tRNA dimethylallyltransferase